MASVPPSVDETSEYRTPRVSAIIEHHRRSNIVTAVRSPLAPWGTCGTGGLISCGDRVNARNPSHRFDRGGASSVIPFVNGSSSQLPHSLYSEWQGPDPDQSPWGRLLGRLGRKYPLVQEADVERGVKGIGAADADRASVDRAPSRLAARRHYLAELLVKAAMRTTSA